jgi:hypothetical protein
MVGVRRQSLPSPLVLLRRIAESNFRESQSDGDGLWLAFELLRQWPHLQGRADGGTELSPDEAALCDRQDFPALRKPFLAQDVLSVIQARLLHSSTVGGNCGGRT